MLKSFAEIPELSPQFLIDPYIPRTGITLIAGDGGVGKSYVECSLIADLSRGNRTILDQEETMDFTAKRRKPLKILLLNAEDDPSYVTAGRLRQCGADMFRVFTPDYEDLPNYKIGTPYFESNVSSAGVDLVVIDPIQAFLPSNVAYGQREKMRQCLNTLNQLGHKHYISFLITVHTNKTKGSGGRSRLSGSADLWDIARSVMVIGKAEDEDERYISHEKTNYAFAGPTVIYILQDGIPTAIRTVSERDAYFCSLRRNKPSERDSKLGSAQKFILDQLASGEISIGELDRLAVENGISAPTLERAKKILYQSGAIKRKNTGFGKTKAHTLRLGS